MTVRAYRTQPFQTTHENRVFDALRNELERVWGHSEEILILLETSTVTVRRSTPQS